VDEDISIVRVAAMGNDIRVSQRRSRNYALSLELLEDRQLLSVFVASPALIAPGHQAAQQQLVQATSDSPGQADTTPDDDYGTPAAGFSGTSSPSANPIVGPSQVQPIAAAAKTTTGEYA